MLAAVATASKCKKRHNSSMHGFTWQPFVKGIWGSTSLRRTKNLPYIDDYIKNIPIRVSWIWPFNDFLRNEVGGRSLATKVSPSEVTPGEILSQILASFEDPNVSKEETCFSYIKELCIAGNLSGAARLIQSLHGKYIFLSPCAYDYVLESAGKRNNIQLLSEIFKDLLVSCRNVRLTSYLILAGAFAKHNHSSMLIKFVEEVSEMEFSRKDIVLNRFIFTLGKCGHVEKSLLVFNHMKSLSCKPDLVTYNTILAFLGKLGRVDEMLQEFNFMKTMHVFPDVVTYNTMLNSLQKMGRLGLCLAYYKEMSERGLQPDVYSFKALIEILGRSGKIQEALNVFDEMKCGGIYPSVHIYRALIFSLKKMGMMELALKFSKEMNELFREFPLDFS